VCVCVRCISVCLTCMTHVTSMRCVCVSTLHLCVPIMHDNRHKHEVCVYTLLLCVPNMHDTRYKHEVSVCVCLCVRCVSMCLCHDNWRSAMHPSMPLLMAKVYTHAHMSTNLHDDSISISSCRQARIGTRTHGHKCNHARTHIHTWSSALHAALPSTKELMS